MKLTEQDFQNLWDTSMAWGSEWRAQDGRFDPPVSYEWRQAYWFELSYANLVMARTFLESKGEDYEVSSDEAGGWILLTNYEYKGALV
jgi:hypothetical protein